MKLISSQGADITRPTNSLFRVFHYWIIFALLIFNLVEMKANEKWLFPFVLKLPLPRMGSADSWANGGASSGKFNNRTCGPIELYVQYKWKIVKKHFGIGELMFGLRNRHMLQSPFCAKISVDGWTYKTFEPLKYRVRHFRWVWMKWNVWTIQIEVTAKVKKKSWA